MHPHGASSFGTRAGAHKGFEKTTFTFTGVA